MLLDLIQLVNKMTFWTISWSSPWVQSIPAGQVNKTLAFKLTY